MTLDDFPKNDLGHHMGVVKSTGERVRVLCIDAPGNYPEVVIGTHGVRSSINSVVPAPPRREYWINEYPDGLAKGWRTKEEADACADKFRRIGPARRVVFED